MDENFNKNVLKPGDTGYQYDKEEDFGPGNESNEWDESDYGF